MILIDLIIMISLVGVLGLVVGSFLNVVILRTQAKTAWWSGRSQCPSCHHQLAWYELIPVLSYLVQKGKCVHCHTKISAQYILVELSTAILFIVSTTLFWQQPVRLAFTLIYVSLLIILFVYDLRYYLILDRFTLPGIVVAIIGSLILGTPWWSVGLGILIGGGIFLIQFVVSRGKWIGGGDLRLGVLIGAMVGFPNILVALFLAYLLGASVAITLVLGKRKGWQDQLPFGTFLSVATIITLLFGSGIIHWYMYEMVNFPT